MWPEKHQEFVYQGSVTHQSEGVKSFLRKLTFLNEMAKLRRLCVSCCYKVCFQKPLKEFSCCTLRRRWQHTPPWKITLCALPMLGFSSSIISQSVLLLHFWQLVSHTKIDVTQLTLYPLQVMHDSSIHSLIKLGKKDLQGNTSFPGQRGLQQL